MNFGGIVLLPIEVQLQARVACLDIMSLLDYFCKLFTTIVFTCKKSYIQFLRMSSDSQPESLSQRQQSIVDWVRRHGYATIETMAEEFSVSAQTIRREIIELNHRRILQRHHGGA